MCRDQRIETADLLALVATGDLAPSRLDQALVTVGLAPDAAGWRQAATRLMATLSVLFVIAAVICLVAANWQAIGSMAKFAAAVLVLTAVVVMALVLGLERRAGQWLLVLAIGLIGPLLALYGQTYQTGADIHKLMFTWAALALPWMIASRQALAWLLVLAIFEGACLFWLGAFDLWFWLPRPIAVPTWLGAALVQALALVGWELAAHRLTWLRGRWAPRVIAGALLMTLTLGACLALWFDVLPWRGLAIVCWLLGLAGIVFTYGGFQRRGAGPDIAMLSLVLLSLTAFAQSLAWAAFRSSLLTGLVVLAVVAVGAWALRHWQLRAGTGTGGGSSTGSGCGTGTGISTRVGGREQAP